MAQTNKTEFWLRGPVADIPALLQPVAHALLQARMEVADMTTSFPDELLWVRPAGLASAGFHLQHLSGVLDRLFCYARGEQLQPTQLEYLQQEATPAIPVTTLQLTTRFSQQVDSALLQLAATDETTLTSVREVGRAKIPSTVIGLVFHAAEHTQRHVGQLLVTINVVKEQSGREKLPV